MERSPSQKARDRRDGERPVWVTAAALIAALWGHAQLGEAWWGCRRYLREARDEASRRIPSYHSAEVGGKRVSVLEPEWYGPWRFTNSLLRLGVGFFMIVSAVFLWKLAQVRHFAGNRAVFRPPVDAIRGRIADRWPSVFRRRL
ncbi:MAG: hypothetical protein ACYTKD_30195, partial [Planctomycetota bacterium]